MVWFGGAKKEKKRNILSPFPYVSVQPPPPHNLYPLFCRRELGFLASFVVSSIAATCWITLRAFEQFRPRRMGREFRFPRISDALSYFPAARNLRGRLLLRQIEREEEEGGD